MEDPQGRLDFDNPIVHADDPPSSHDAAASALPNRGHHARLVHHMVQAWPGRTAGELWYRACGIAEYRNALKELQEVRRRLTDLLALGLVRQGTPRKCTRRGTKQCTWHVMRTLQER